jgi:hypothetical protein
MRYHVYEHDNPITYSYAIRVIFAVNHMEVMIRRRPAVRAWLPYAWLGFVGLLVPRDLLDMLGFLGARFISPFVIGLVGDSHCPDPWLGITPLLPLLYLAILTPNDVTTSHFE